MANFRGYIGIQRINANFPVGMWNSLIALIDQVGGIDDDNQPHNRLQKRTSLDGNNVLYEANFNPANIRFNAFITRAANALGVDPALVTVTTAQQTFAGVPTVIGTVVYNAQNRFRVVLFGASADNLLPDWETSHLEILAFLQTNRAAWEPTPP